MESIKIDYVNINNVYESLAASGLPMDGGDLDFAKICGDLMMGLDIGLENFNNYLIKNKEVYFMGRALNNAELIATLMFEDWEEKDDVFYTNDMQMTLEQAVAATAQLPKVDMISVMNVLNRARSLGTSAAGSGHNCFLKGIEVSMNITAPQYFFLQWERYSFQDTVSSQSTMHRLVGGKDYNHLVASQTKANIDKLIEMYNNDAPTEEYELFFGIAPTTKAEKFEAIISNIPEGLMITRRVTTNFLQLATMVAQRDTHKIAPWREFAKFWKEDQLFSFLTQK